MRAAFSTPFCILLLLLVGCDGRWVPPQPVEQSQLTQVSIINALMLGEYDGVMTIRDLLRYGDLGLGTLDHLDGEMIILDGRAYQARSDGAVVEVGPQVTTPFAIITRFAKQGELPCKDIRTLEEFEAKLDGTLANDDLFYAIRVSTELDSLTIRSVPRQEPPYQPLAEVTKHQTVWTHENVKGTLVGFRCPKWSQGLNVPGYHWHFLSADHKVGGHVLNCRIATGTASFSRCDSWLIKLNESLGSHGAELNVDLSRELDKVERQRESEPAPSR